MDCYRIVLRGHAATPLGFGQGAGRWNSRLHPVLYASSSVSLAMTEYLCIKGQVLVQSQWSLLTYSITGDIPYLETSSLPKGWDARPYALISQQLGDDWQRRQTSVALTVPSARLLLSAYPREHNVVLNPFHPEFLSKVKVKAVEDLHFHLNSWATGKAHPVR
ncbi:MAG TPA: RES family NAD+ phosphorylase [Cyclobacteriaceae bacterium]|nr:RES family NAD+ phosphorylase [Cyclobacteriaceae bacterium]